MEPGLRFRWLGVAGLEFATNGQSLLIDPFVTRPPFLRLLAGRTEPNRSLIARHIPQADTVLVTHPHWDHLMDVPEVARRTGATVYGSPNTGALMRALGVPPDRLRPLAAGDRLTLGAFTVAVLPAQHLRVFGRPILAGTVSSTLRAPARLRDYRMDYDYSFLIEAGGLRLLDWSSETPAGAPPADVLFVKPFGGMPPAYAELLRTVRPRLVVPIHWDDFFRPLVRPLRPSYCPPAWNWPPLRRVDLAMFRVATERLLPGSQVFVPEIFRTYALRRKRRQAR